MTTVHRTVYDDAASISDEDDVNNYVFMLWRVLIFVVFFPSNNNSETNSKRLIAALQINIHYCVFSFVDCLSVFFIF